MAPRSLSELSTDGCAALPAGGRRPCEGASARRRRLLASLKGATACHVVPRSPVAGADRVRSRKVRFIEVPEALADDTAASRLPGDRCAPGAHTAGTGGETLDRFLALRRLPRPCWAAGGAPLGNDAEPDPLRPSRGLVAAVAVVFPAWCGAVMILF